MLFKFVLAREPYIRVLVAYMDKLRSNQDEYRLFSRRDAKVEARSGRRRMTTYDPHLSPDSMRSHWRPQAELCGISELPYDLVGRMESLAAGVIEVFRALNRADARFP